MSDDAELTRLQKLRDASERMGPGYQQRILAIDEQIAKRQKELEEKPE